MKSIAILLATSVVAAPAIAGPYANIENNAGWVGSDFGSSVTEVHAGYSFDSGLYLQGGPAFIAIEGEEGSAEFSGKVGYSTDLSEKVNVYGEVGFLTEDRELEFSELNLGTKVGLTYKF